MRIRARFFLLALGTLTILLMYTIRTCNQNKNLYTVNIEVMDDNSKAKQTDLTENPDEADSRIVAIKSTHQNGDDDTTLGTRPTKSQNDLGGIPSDIVFDQFKKNALFTAKSKDVNADILNMPDLHFLRGMKNPCWLEPLTSANPYEESRPLPYLMGLPHVLDGVLDHYAAMYNKSDNPYRIRCLPYFYILGVQKCGTSDLYERLVMHPDFYPCLNKELHWWDNLHSAPINNVQTKQSKIKQFPSLDDYIGYFDDAAYRISKATQTIGSEIKGVAITGEATPSTLWDNKNWRAYPGNAGREDPKYLIPHFMHHLQPDAKFLITLRNPTARLYSGYLYFSERPSLEQFHKWSVLVVKQFKMCVNESSVRKCAHETEHPTNELQLLKKRLRMGLYVVDIEEWMSVFPKENFKVVTLEERNKNPVEQMKEIFSFLKMDPVDDATEERIRRLNPVNVNIRVIPASLGPMLNATKTILDEFYQPYNQRLARLLDDPKFNWTG